MAPIDTFGANHDIVKALNKHGVRYLVVGGAATKHYVRERPTEHAGELGGDRADNAGSGSPLYWERGRGRGS
jgi:hypothetical protein